MIHIRMDRMFADALFKVVIDGNDDTGNNNNDICVVDEIKSGRILEESEI